MEQRLFLVSVTLTGLLNTSFEQSREDGTISSVMSSKLDHFQTLVSVNEKLNPVKSGIRTRRQSSLEEGGRANARLAAAAALVSHRFIHRGCRNSAGDYAALKRRQIGG